MISTSASRLAKCATPVLGRLGNLRTRLAGSADDLRLAQELRYAVFYQEMLARPDEAARRSGRDADAWDAACDHLLVFDTPAAEDDIVGTYRLLTQANAASAGLDFYSQAEFDLKPLLARHKHRNFMELGRSCVLPQWRTKRTIELLWAGIWAYVIEHGVDVMIGCASFEGTDPGKIAEPLSFLFHNAAPPADWSVRAQPHRAIPMNRMAPDMIDARRALRALPPLIKGYLRLGAWIAQEAVIDEQFATTDILVILPVSRLNPRYVDYYGADASRHARR